MFLSAKTFMSMSAYVRRAATMKEARFFEIGPSTVRFEEISPRLPLTPSC